MYGHFSGINRKVQMKYQPKGRPRGSSSDDGKNTYSAFIYYVFYVGCMKSIAWLQVTKNRFSFVYTYGELEKILSKSWI